MNPEDAQKPEGSLFFCGYASIFNVKDREGDIILQNSLQTPNQNIPLLKEHDSNNIIGLITKMKPDNLGLYVEGFIDPSGDASAEIIRLLEGGILTSLSIGYIVKESHEENYTRIIDGAEVVEISIVAIPTNEMAKITKIYRIDSTDESAQEETENTDLVFARQLEGLRQVKEKILNLLNSVA